MGKAIEINFKKNEKGLKRDFGQLFYRQMPVRSDKKDYIESSAKMLHTIKDFVTRIPASYELAMELTLRIYIIRFYMMLEKLTEDEKEIYIRMNPVTQSNTILMGIFHCIETESFFEALNIVQCSPDTNIHNFADMVNEFCGYDEKMRTLMFFAIESLKFKASSDKAAVAFIRHMTQVANEEEEELIKNIREREKVQINEGVPCPLVIPQRYIKKVEDKMDKSWMIEEQLSSCEKVLFTTEEHSQLTKQEIAETKYKNLEDPINQMILRNYIPDTEKQEERRVSTPGDAGIRYKKTDRSHIFKPVRTGVF